MANINCGPIKFRTSKASYAKIKLKWKKTWTAVDAIRVFLSI